MRRGKDEREGEKWRNGEISEDKRLVFSI